jgi:hypothetical protein
MFRSLIRRLAGRRPKAVHRECVAAVSLVEFKPEHDDVHLMLCVTGMDGHEVIYPMDRVEAETFSRKLATARLAVFGVTAGVN